MVDAVEEAASKKNLHICKMLVGVVVAKDRQ
jgi:hypothetical protein